MAASEATAPVRAVSTAEHEPADALARSLLLMRASTTSIVRFQLAMERCDRRVAIESLDELMQLDRRLGALVGTLAPDQLASDVAALEQQQRALAVERLVLAAGTSGPRLAPVSDMWIEQPPIALEAARETRVLPDVIEPDAAEEPVRDRAGIALVMLLVAAILFGAAAFFLFTDAGRGLIGGAAV